MIKDKRILVTGSSSGLGFEIAKFMIDGGAKVVLNGRDTERLSGASKKLLNAPCAQGDVSDPASCLSIVQNTARMLGGLDCLVCNVGSGRSVLPGKETIGEWKRVFDVNFWSAVNVIDAAVPELEKAKGSIVCISSICGVEVIPGAPVTYSVAKAALNAFVRGMSRPLAEKNIRINGVAPGNLMFPGSVWESKYKENKEKVCRMLKSDVPLRRFGNPEEIAKVVAHLGMGQDNFATGSIWVVDGGQTRAF
jgi:NAD(P)-dependent dehydrogenase (short-subunit alcohol dehydrogenase family)